MEYAGIAPLPGAASFDFNCDDIAVGTLEDLSDVVREGLVRAEYRTAEFEYLQSKPHAFFIRGSVPLVANPVVYSRNV